MRSFQPQARSNQEQPRSGFTDQTRAGRATVACAALLLGLTGCQSPLPPVFPPHNPPLVWPPSPDRPRIRYIGELTGEASLGARPQGWAALRAVLEGPPPQTPFVAPAAVAVHGETVFVADSAAPGGPAVHRLDLNARTFATIRMAGGAPLELPIDVTMMQGDQATERPWLAVADARRAAVFLFDWNGRSIRVIGRGELQRPAGVAWDSVSQELWVSDAAAHACFVFSSEGALLRRVGRRGTDRGELNYPAGLACAAWDGSPLAMVTDAMNFRVQVFEPAGRPLLRFGRKGDAAGDFSLPRDVAADSDGNIYVLDNQFENVQIFSRMGQLLLAFGEEGRGPGQFSLPSGITIDGLDRIWVADTYNRRVQVFQYLPDGREDQP